MTRPRGCRAGRPPESPSPAPGEPSDDTTVAAAGRPAAFASLRDSRCPVARRAVAAFLLCSVALLAPTWANAQVDTTPPALESATVAADGNSIQLTFDEVIDAVAAALQNYTLFTVTANGSQVFTSVAAFVTVGPLAYRVIEIPTLTPITHGQTVVVSYIDDTTGDDTIGILQDAAGNDVADFTTGSGGVPAVVNTVPEPPPGPRSFLFHIEEDRMPTIARTGRQFEMWFIFQNLGKPVFLNENILDAIQVEHGMASNVRCLVEAFVSCASSPNSGHNYYVFTVTADESQYSGSEGTLTVSLRANVIEGGNQAAQREFSVDLRDLTVTLAGPPQQPVTGDFNVGIEFNLSVQTQSGNLEGDPLWHFRIDDVTVDRGQVRSISGADTTWSTEIRPPDSYEGDLTVQILADAVRAEEYTNGNEASEVLSVQVDTRPPTVTITARETVARKSTFTVTFTFREPVTGFTEDDIGVAGGTLVAGSLSGTEADPVWTVRVTAAEMPDNDQVGISLPPDKVTDEAGNLNSALEELFVTVVDEPDPTDQTALEALYNATGGPAWTNNMNWLTNEALSGWYGVTTNSDGHVTSLDLTNNQLTGPIPAELGDLANLRELALYSNELSGEIPAELGNLAELQRLYLYSNELSGEIPAALGNLTNLEWLYLYGNELSGEIPAALGKLDKLQFLYLFQNQLSGEIPEELGDLDKLQKLDLSQNQLSGEIPEELGNLASLQSLILQYNQLTGPIPEELGKLAELQFLFLHVNMLSGKIPAELGKLDNLQNLSLHRNMLTGEIPAELGDLANLQNLYLYSNELSGKIPEELGNLASLQWLYLYSNELSGEIPAELGDLANLQRLSLSGNMLDGKIPAALGNLTELRELYLWGNKLTGPIPGELGNLASLQRLSLSQNMLDGEIPEKLGDLTNLQWLYLNDNMLSGEIPAELGDLAELQRLYLHSNELTGEIPSWLVNLMELLELSLWSNQLPRMIPDEVAPAQDRAALRVLYNATGDANWTNNTNWLTNEAISEWYGVSTDGQGRVEELRLFDNGLTGTIGAELGVLTRLQFLYLDHNRLSGKIPAELGDLDSLRELYLWDNELLSGPLPLTLSELSQLAVLDIRKTTLCAPVDAEFQAWLATINFQGTVCATRPGGGGGDDGGDPGGGPPGGGGSGGGVGGGGGAPRTSAPEVPRNLTAVGGDGQVVLTWEPPASDEGAEITDYEYRIDRRNPWISTGSTDTTHTVSGLVNGTVYVFEVRAVNRIGKGRASDRAEATPEAPEVLDFAHFANGTGIASDLVFVNLDSHPIQPAIYFYDTEGALVSADSVLDVTGDLEVTDDGGLTIQTEMEPLGVLTISTHGQGELVSGSVKVVSNGLIAGFVRYSVPGVGVAGVGASPAVRDALFPARRQAGGIRTAAALHNLGEEAMGVSCRLMSGGVALEEVEIPLAANGQTSWFIEDVFTMSDTADFAGSVRCAAPGNGRFTAIAVEMDVARRIFTALPVALVDRGGGGREAALDFAHFANGTGTTSDLVFVNMKTQPSGPAPTPFHTAIPPIRPAIYFYDTRGNPIAADSLVDVTGDLEITEDGALTVQTQMEPLGVLTISTHGRGELVSGSVKVLSDGPIGGMLRFDLPHIGEAVVGASPPASDAIFPVRRQEGGITTGVALHNLESSPGLLRCDLMREGVLLDAASIPLEANGQTSWLIDQAFTDADTSDFAGSVRCDAVGEGLFSAVALEMDPATRTFITLPVFPVPEMPSQE